MEPSRDDATHVLHLERWAVRRLGLHLAAALLGSALVACSGGGDSGGATPASCPNVSTACPDSGAPSFTMDVQPVLEDRCYGCHAPGGVGFSTNNLTTYSGAQQADILGAVSTCTMPPPDAGPLSLDQRTTLLQWVGCGKPND